MNDLTLTLRAQDDLKGARELQEKVLEISRRIQGDKHPDTSTYEWNLLMILWEQHDEPAAMKLCENLGWLLERAAESLGAVHQQIRNNLEQLLKKYQRGPSR
jgi:hypothetical protein